MQIAIEEPFLDLLALCPSYRGSDTFHDSGDHDDGGGCHLHPGEGVEAHAGEGDEDHRHTDQRHHLTRSG